MSNSFDFCKMVAQDESRSSYADRSWDNAFECFETEAIFDKYLHGARKFFLEETNDCKVKIYFDVSIFFNCNSDFDYFTSESCIHDGTLFFISELMDKCVRKVCLAHTYNKNIGAPDSGDSVRYVVGNFIVLTEHDEDFAPVDKPWIRERTTVLLPLKMIKG